LSEIRRLEQKHGRAPGQNLFSAETGIAQHEWRGRFWARWGDALAEAGFGPNPFGSKRDSKELLTAVADVALRMGRVPTFTELTLLRREDPNIPPSKTVANHFKKDALVANLRKLAQTDHRYVGLVAILPESTETDAATSSRQEGWVYLLRSGQHYKIGRSDTLERRVREVGVAMPDSTILEHAIRTDDPVGIESYWHRRFAEKRVGGEWFKLSRAEVAAFKRRKFQ
jgi:hypothetical protein